MYTLLTYYNKKMFKWDYKSKSLFISLHDLLESSDQLQLREFKEMFISSTLPYFITVINKERKNYCYVKQDGKNHIWKTPVSGIHLIVNMGTYQKFDIKLPRSMQSLSTHIKK